MKNKITLTLDLTFSEDANVTKKDMKEIIANVMDALKRQINNGMGLAPEESEYITDVIEIKHKEDKLKSTFDFRGGQIDF